MNKKKEHSVLDDLLAYEINRPIKYLITAGRVEYSFILQYVKGKRKESKAIMARAKQARKN